jgi:hypothetical protein
VGKSNVLKALNLFFNNETDYEKPLNFNEDYCKYTPFKNKKAKEIIIELIIIAPRTYKGAQDIKWRKVWRDSGLFEETLAFKDGTSFPRKTKLYSWLKNIRFTYVPAIRGTSYFQILLAKLHDTFVETSEAELRTAGEDFIRNIKSNTEKMINEISQRLDIKSQIGFPSNLQTIFKTLDFITTEEKFNISLSNRGDGIKTRHIPSILKFISDQLNSNKGKGSININMIWGYEEPENNLEMSATFELAKQFIDYSNEIQILMTTHSPGFYSLKSKNPTIVNLFKVVKPKHQDTQITGVVEQIELDNEMGIMPIITPYIEQKINEISELESSVKAYKQELENINNNILLVEGDDEVRVFSKIISQSAVADDLIVNKSSGCSGVRMNLIACSWISGTSLYKTIGIFDHDLSGKNEFAKLNQEPRYTETLNRKKVKGLIYKPPSHLINIKQKLHNFPIELEEMYPYCVWEIAQNNNWLITRDIKELSTFISLDSANQTLMERIEQHGFSTEEKIYIYNKVQDQHKEKLSKFVIQDDSLTVQNKMNPLIVFFDQDILPFFNT